MSLRRATIAAVALAGACGPQQLEGSLSTLMDLKYQRMTASSSSDEMVVRFSRPQGSGEDLVLQVSAKRTGLAPEALLFDLAEVTPQGTQRGALSRNVLNDPHRTFPSLLRGRLQFNRPLTVGQGVTGSFSVTFAEGTVYAAGRTVYGNFGATVQ